MAEEQTTPTPVKEQSTSTKDSVESTDEVSSEAPKKKSRKKVKKSVPFGRVYIQASFNNTMVTVTNKNGDVIAASSAGACGFKGSKKGTAYAAQVASETVMERVQQVNGMKQVDVFVKGIGLGRDSAIRSLLNTNVQINSITDQTGIAHGGCRQRRERRV